MKALPPKAAAKTCSSSVTANCTRITRDEVYVADEAFFTGSAAEVTPIREYDNRAIGCGSRGPITQKLQALYFDYVHGRKADHAEWLTYVA
jgi:branched-chain amino acid aminotransferase